MKDVSEFPGRDHVKRALEVAAVGNHSMLIVARKQHAPVAREFAETARALAFQIADITITEPCFCGYAGDPYRACVCSVRASERFQRRMQTFEINRNIAMHVDFGDVSFEQMTSTRRRETNEQIGARVLAARERAVPDLRLSALPSDSMRLMHAAVRQLALSEKQIESVLAVAGSIARLAGDRDIRPVPIAEALQYRIRV